MRSGVSKAGVVCLAVVMCSLWGTAAPTILRGYAKALGDDDTCGEAFICCEKYGSVSCAEESQCTSTGGSWTGGHCVNPPECNCPQPSPGPPPAYNDDIGTDDGVSPGTWHGLPNFPYTGISGNVQAVPIVVWLSNTQVVTLGPTTHTRLLDLTSDTWKELSPMPEIIGRWPAYGGGATHQAIVYEGDVLLFQFASGLLIHRLTMSTGKWSTEHIGSFPPTVGGNIVAAFSGLDEYARLLIQNEHNDYSLCAYKLSTSAMEPRCLNFSTSFDNYNPFCDWSVVMPNVTTLAFVSALTVTEGYNPYQDNTCYGEHDDSYRGGLQNGQTVVISFPADPKAWNETKLNYLAIKAPPVPSVGSTVFSLAGKVIMIGGYQIRNNIPKYTDDQLAWRPLGMLAQCYDMSTGTWSKHNHGPYPSIYPGGLVHAGVALNPNSGVAIFVSGFQFSKGTAPGQYGQEDDQGLSHLYGTQTTLNTTSIFQPSFTLCP